MGKGKKFDAAEKHFEKKRLEWTRQIKELESENRRLRESNLEFIKEAQELRLKAAKLEEENAKLMELKFLSKEDLAILLNNAHRTEHMHELFSILGKFPSMP